MSYADWCAEPLGDGRHRFDALPLPPLHPLTHGQFAVDITVVGQRIAACRFDVSGSYRGDEKLLEVRDFKQGLALINRHGWLTASFAETLYARLIEQALGMTISARAAALRELVLALNAAATEAYWTAVGEQLEGRHPSLDTREAILAVLERITGARMHATYVRIGGVAADINEQDADAIRALGLPDVDAALAAALASDGEIAVQLPKVLRLPQGEYYGEIATPHGALGIWLISKGDKVPHRVHLRTAGFAALAALERSAIGMGTEEFFLRLAATRLVIGEVAR